MSMCTRLCRCTMILPILAIAGCSGWAPKVFVEEQRELQIPARFAKLEVETHNGAIIATGEPAADEVQVIAKVRGGGSNRESALACVSAIELVSMTEEGVHRLGWTYNTTRASDWVAEVGFKVTLPPTLELSSRTHNGSIDVVGMNAGCRLVTHNGSIHVDAGAGPLVAETHNGSIDARSHAARIELAAHNGGLEVEALAADALAGRITTHNGNVRMGLTDGVATELTCDTHNGRVDVDVPWQAFYARKSHAAGRLGAGGTQFRVETHNGSIAIRRTHSDRAPVPEPSGARPL